MRKLLFTALFLVGGFSFCFSQSYCDNFKIVSILDFPPSPQLPGGNYFLLLLTVEVENQVNRTIYTNLYFTNEQGDTISIPTGPSSNLPVYPTDTIPYVMKLSTTLRNQDFPIDFNGNLVIQHVREPICEVPYSNVTSSTRNVSDNSQIALYPNPFVSHLNLQSERQIEQLTIFNSLGVSIKSYHPRANSVDLNLGSVSKGEYFVAARFVDGTVTVRRLSKI